MLDAKKVYYKILKTIEYREMICHIIQEKVKTRYGYRYPCPGCSSVVYGNFWGTYDSPEKAEQAAKDDMDAYLDKHGELNCCNA